MLDADARIRGVAQNGLPSRRIATTWSRVVVHPGVSRITALFALLTLAGPSGETCLTVGDEKKAYGEEIEVEEVSFQDGDHSLSGSLYRPQHTGAHPAIAMILGSDRQDRDFGGEGPVLGRHFARAGFACLFWDKPGVGRSTGDFHSQTFRDRAREALAAVRFLGGRQDIRRDRIGLWGHSQGGMVAPLAASMSPGVAFLIE